MEKQEDIFNSYNLFKIPEIQLQTLGAKKKVIIGLIDASGSMGSYWQALVKFWNEKIAAQTDVLITFSQNSKVQASAYLNQSLKVHGGGMTNILDAFKKLQEQLQLIQKTASITVVFISDGDDTVNGEAKLTTEMLKLKGGQGRDITFLCLGIQSGFPTKISMRLRQLYHTGDQMIPAIYLIQYASQKAFFNKFETMSNCFKALNKIAVKVGGEYIKQYPWQENGQVDFKQGKWVMVHKQFPQIEILYNDIENRSIKITTLKEISLDQLVDCFRGWVQKVQILSMDNSKMQETKKIAKQTFDTMKNYTIEFQKIYNISIVSQNKVQKQSFKERVKNLAVKNIGSRIKWYLDQLEIIAKGVGIGQLSEYDAAKRLAIGTITGKYHQKALALKGITQKDFVEIKKQFQQVFKKVKLSQEPSKQQVSIFTLQNQKEVFQQEDFLEGLQFCKTQFDLVETFPVVGYGLKVKRYDGSMINPWKVRLQSLAKTHKTIDSMYLAKNSNKYILSIGNDQTEQINAVLPLFSLQDSQMSELFNTRLFKLAVSFMVVQNIDTYHDEAYLALLGTTYVFLLKQPVSEWRNSLIDLIYTSLKVTYGATKEFQQFIQAVEDNPYKLWQNKGKQDHVDIVKILILIFYISRQGRLSHQKLSHLVDLALVHYCEKTYVENEFKIFRVCQLKLGQNIDKDFEKKQKQIKQKQDNEFDQLGKCNFIKDDTDLRSVVDQKMKDFLNLKEIDMKLSDKIFLQEDQERRVTYSQIQSFYKQLTKNELNKKEKQILYYFGHYCKGTTQQNYLKPVIKDMKDVQKSVLSKVDLKNVFKTQGKQIKKLRKRIQERYVDHFRATHFGIVPISQQKLIEDCTKLKINKNQLQVDGFTRMIKNACMSPHCSFYLKPMTQKQLIDHLRLWHGRMPARFHMTVRNYIQQKKTPQQICQQLFKSNLVNLQKHKKNEQFVKNYIIAIQKALQQK